MSQSQFDEFWHNKYSKLAKMDISDHEKTHDIKTIMDKRKKLLLNFLKKVGVANLNILDAGCGIGVFCNLLADQGYTVTGIDYSQDCIDIAEHNKKGRNINYLVNDLYSLDFPDDTFDITMCFAALQHVENARRAIDELIRVTKKGGFILLNTKRQPTNFEIFLIRIYLTLFSYHNSKYNKSEIKKTIQILKNRTYLTEKIGDTYFPIRYKVSEFKLMFRSKGIKKIKVHYHNRISRIGANDMMVVAQK